MSGEETVRADAAYAFAGGWPGWAARQTWNFESYYKYTFIFRCEGKGFFTPADTQFTSFTATVSVGGHSADIYRYGVAPEMSWNDAIYGGDWTLTIRTEGGVIFSTDPHLMPEKTEGGAG